MQNLSLDLSRDPFSRSGSWLSLAYEGAERPQRPFGDALYLRSHHGCRVNVREIFAIDCLKNGKVVPHQTKANVAEVQLLPEGGGRVRFCFAANDSILVEIEGCDLRLRTAILTGHVAYRDSQTRVTVNTRQSFRRFHIEALAGSVDLDAPWKPDQCASITVTLGSNGGIARAAIDEFWSTWIPRSRPSFDAATKAVRDEMSAFAAAFGAPRPGIDTNTYALAIYLMWALTVQPTGILKRPAVFMSKHWMDQVWSWDHCFNAQALMGAHDALAIDQWFVMFDHQDEFGAIPDALNDVTKHYNFCKPPVHGWTLARMLERCNPAILNPHLPQAYDHLTRWTNWWLTHRRAEGQILPHYLHGNDSGWDNSTMFDEGVPLQGPDLAALLSVQCHVLAELAPKVGRASETAAWKIQATTLREALIAQTWKNGRFQPQRLTPSGQIPVVCESLIPAITVFLGQDLPKEIQAVLTKDLERFVTSFGLATEWPSSPRYSTDGYWRGPSWAPSSYLAIDGLRRIGAHDLAGRIAKGFCAACDKSGFAENYDALSGKGLRDPSYSWTAAVYLLLTRQNLG